MLREDPFVDAMSAEEVLARWRALVRVAHPDMGGDSESFGALRKFYDAARARVASGLPCPVCEGFGVTRVGTGFIRLSTPCTRCGGSGKR